MEEWNVVVTVQPGRYREACRLLEAFGRVRRTVFYNVITVKVEDARQFLESLRERLIASPAQCEGLRHVMPAQKTFRFQSPEEFEGFAREAVGSWVPELAGKTFYVRIHRRGFKGRLSSQDEERFLDKFLLASLEKIGCPGRITFDDPDAICAVETIGQWAGLSLWTREDRHRFPFLHVD
jgi:tRNA(Ser,Leu) C12 N-acetylase TAN1